MSATSLVDRLHHGPPLLLDGPLGTELQRRGVATTLPLWSAWGLLRKPDVVGEIHREYLAAGADVVTTNTFRTHRRSLAHEGLGLRAEELTRLAVRLARRAVQQEEAEAEPREAEARQRRRPAWVAGSMAPLEDCYRPDLTPPDGQLRAEHERLAGWLADAAVDVLLVETMPTIREAVAATRAAVATGLPVITGLVCDTRGALLSGEGVAAAAVELEALGPAGLAINCTPAHALHRALDRLAEATELPLGAYGNVGHAEDRQGWSSTDVLGPERYLALARRWLAAGARLVGSCCGTTPEHTAALRREIDGSLPGGD